MLVLLNLHVKVRCQLCTTSVEDFWVSSTRENTRVYESKREKQRQAIWRLLRSVVSSLYTLYVDLSTSTFTLRATYFFFSLTTSWYYTRIYHVLSLFFFFFVSAFFFPSFLLCFILFFFYRIFLLLRVLNTS